MMKKEVNRPAPRRDRALFSRKVLFTASLTFSLLVLGYLILYSVIADEGGKAFDFATFTRYTLFKFLFLAAFSVSLGFLNRLFDWNKPRPVVRLIHFGGAFASFLFFILFLMNQMEPVDSETVTEAARTTPLTPRYIVFSVVMFLVVYFVSVGVHALAHRILHGKDEKEFKSIFQ